jgi:predicted HTH transcriptional regulator
MELRDLKRLTAEGEHLHLEFKRKANHPDKIIREFVAFANTQGGILLLGVEDDGSIHGTKEPEGDVYSLTETVKRMVKPELKLGISRVPITSRRAVLVFSVKESKRKPHFIREDGKKKSFVRVRDMSVQASREMVDLMYLSRRSNGVRIEYGETERKLLQYLEEVTRTTLNLATQHLQISRRQTSRLLVTLVRAGLVEIHPTEGEDYFTLAHEAYVG